jgi:alkylation response protein AidB-like acyl-CoA dehydrogenase
MNFDLAVDELQLRTRALALAREQIAPSVSERDRDSRWDPGLFLTLAGQGMLGAPWERESGGGGCTMAQACLMLEGVGAGAQDAGLGAAWVTHTFSCGLSIARFAGSAERARYLPALAAGELVGAYCGPRAVGPREPSPPIRAAIRGAGWVLDGTAQCVIHAPIADLFVVAAHTADGHLAFLVPRALRGVEVGDALDGLGMRTVPCAKVRFHGCELPDAALLRDPGADALGVVARIQRAERVATSAHDLGLLDACFDMCRERVRDAHELGRPLRASQAARMRLADLRIQGELARHLVYRAASWFERGDAEADLSAACALLFTTDALALGAEHVVRCNGWTAESDSAGRLCRDAAARQAAAHGASEVLRSVVAGAVVGLG